MLTLRPGIPGRPGLPGRPGSPRIREKVAAIQLPVSQVIYRIPALLSPQSLGLRQLRPKAPGKT